MSDENIELALLGFLVEKPKHGYDLYKEVSDPIGIGEVYRIKIGKMYSILKKFENRNFVITKTIQEGKRPPKNIYSLTKKGETALIEWMSKPFIHGRDFRILFLLKLFFINKNQTINAKQIISNQKNECKNWKKRIALSINDEAGITNYQRIVKHFRLSQIEGYIKWLNWCERTIDEENNA